MSVTIPVFYDPRMVAHPEESTSPSAGKPAEVVASWQAQGFPITIRPFAPVSRDQLALAHDPRYVDGVLDCRIANGFGDRSARVAASLPWTSGAMLAAAREALASGTVATAPCSGFHHAHWGMNHGFCTFNGLMVTAMVLLTEGVARKVGILDADQHYGDGTANIIRKLGRADEVPHVTFGFHYEHRSQAAAFLAELPAVVRSFAGCDVLLYQAGADPHYDDPLGGWLSTAQLAERDRLVFTTCREIGLPVAWDLAGGYQRDWRNSIRPVLDIHDNTMRACVGVYGGA